MLLQNMSEMDAQFLTKLCPQDLRIFLKQNHGRVFIC